MIFRLLAEVALIFLGGMVVGSVGVLALRRHIKKRNRHID